jgi:ribosomal protein S8
MYNYTLSDFISRLNIAKRKHLKTIIIKPSNLIFSLLKIFEELGIIRGYSLLDNYKIEVYLKYHSSRCAFQNLIVVSKPSKRIYVNMLKLYKMKEFYASNILILSTDKGLMLDVNCLKYKKGGLVLLRIIL